MKHELGDEVSVILTITEITQSSRGTYYKATLNDEDTFSIGGFVILSDKDIIENKTKTLEAMANDSR